MLGCGAPVTLATLEVTHQALCRAEEIAALRAAGDGACVRAAVAIWERTPPARRSGGLGSAQHDACAVAWVVAPHLFNSVEVFAEVDCGPGPGRGRTVLAQWARGGRATNARMLTALDTDGFFTLLNARLAALP